LTDGEEVAAETVRSLHQTWTALKERLVAAASQAATARKPEQTILNVKDLFLPVCREVGNQIHYHHSLSLTGSSGFSAGLR